MMLVQSSLPASIDDHGKQESSCVWISSDDSWPKPKNTVPLTVQNIKNDSLWSPNVLSSSQLSSEVNMSETSTLNFVYRRRTIQKNANLCDIFLPNQSSKPTLVYKRRKIQSENSKSGSVDGGSLGDELIEDPKSKFQNCIVLRAVNDSCSSSKSNIDPGSIFLKHQVDDVGECSSSGVVIMEGANSCISFLKRHGMLERLISTKKKTSVKKNICCLRACKVCDQLATTLKMLICDLCEESFHMSCCNPVIKKVPIGDWFCHSCSRKKLKKMKEMNSSKLSKDCLGPIASMLRDVDYTSNVRIGVNFQAEVPDWISPLTDEFNHYLEPMDISPLECASYQELNPTKRLRLSSIGNWLQCREVVDGVDGTVCGKWRRAPLFEVQTDDWECFSSVLWDPTHADCAVPQELDTDQVLKQLKYIEMLRPRLTAKRWKSRVHKGVDQSEHTGDPRKTQKSKV